MPCEGAASWVGVVDVVEKESQGGQKAHHTGRQRPLKALTPHPIPSGLHGFFSQGLRILAVYLADKAPNITEERGEGDGDGWEGAGRSEEKGMVIDVEGRGDWKAVGRGKGQGIEDGREVEEREEASGGGWEGEGWRKGRGGREEEGRRGGEGRRGRGGRD